MSGAWRRTTSDREDGPRGDPRRGRLRVPAAVDLAAIVIGALTVGLLAARGLRGLRRAAARRQRRLGGGLIRDVMLGDLPPVALTNQAYLPTVAITAAVTFFFSGWPRLTTLLIVLDAVTLGFFTVIGAQKAQLLGLASASVVFIGTLTASAGHSSATCSSPSARTSSSRARTTPSRR